MALFIEGMRCPVCQIAMAYGDDVRGFSHFVADRGDPLILFSDATVHRACLEAHAHGKTMLEWDETRARAHQPWPPSCCVCGVKIASPDEYFGTGLLTRDPSLPAYAFNFLHFHQAHVFTWERARALEDAVTALSTSPGWDGTRWSFDHAAQRVRLEPPRAR